MHCPSCNEPMIVIEYEGIEVDICEKCDGIWLDEGELDLLLGKAALKSDTLKWIPVEDIKEKQRPCPVCVNNMSKVRCEEAMDIVVDRCNFPDGIWFDKGELQAVLKGAGAKQSPLVRFFEGIFKP